MRSPSALPVRCGPAPRRRVVRSSRSSRSTPVKVVSERLGHANVAFTMQTYQHLLPGMQADAARTPERLARPVPPATADTVERRRNTRRKFA